MLSFFSRQPVISGQMWENFHYLSNSELEKVESDYRRGISRGHSVEILSSLLNNPNKSIDYEAYEFTCGKNDTIEDFNRLKNIMYLNEEPFDEDGSTVGYGEVSIDKFPTYDNYDGVEDYIDYRRTLSFLLSKRKEIFYEFGFDWVKAILVGLEGDSSEMGSLAESFGGGKNFEFSSALEVLLISRFFDRKDLLGVLEERSWLYE